MKKVFLEISQNSQENTCARSEACNFIKKETAVYNLESYGDFRFSGWVFVEVNVTALIL